MERRNFYILVVSIMIGLSVLFLNIYAIITLDIDLFQDPNTVKIKGSGISGELTLSLSELKSDKYTQVENKEFFFENRIGNTYWRTYSGVSLWSILEQEGILISSPSNLTFLFMGRDAYRSPLPLNLSIAQNNPTKVIIAYAEDGQPLFGDGPLRSVINQTVMPNGEVSSQYSVQQLASIIID